MELPICQSSTNRFMVIDGNGIPVDGLEVCDALNNAAAGAWEKWTEPPKPLCCNERILIMWEGFGIALAWWNQERKIWKVIGAVGDIDFSRVMRFARINISKEATE